MHADDDALPDAHAALLAWLRRIYLDEPDDRDTDGTVIMALAAELGSVVQAALDVTARNGWLSDDERATILQRVILRLDARVIERRARHNAPTATTH